jgi:phage gp46-like protein
VSDFRTALIPGPDGQFPGLDLALDGYQLATDEGLETACLLSLFSDARARPDDVLPDRNGDRRGWWGDGYADVAGDVWGSRLWLYERSFAIPATANGIREAAAEALRWLVADGVVDRIEVDVAFFRPDGLTYTITVYRDRQPARQFEFKQFWAGA